MSGFVNNEKINEYYQRAHIFVSMSRFESWEQMYIEAMACGLAAIVAKNIGSNSIIINNETGHLIEQGDYNSLSIKIIYLIRNKYILNKVSRSSRIYVGKNYDWDKVIIPRYLEIYKQLI